MTNHTRVLSLSLCLLLGPAAAVSAGTPLPQDPNNVYGQFDNGLKYIIRTHDNPPGRVAAYLHIKSGALNETEQQNGIAHFIEHMAFNGSKHFAPGELIAHLNQLGMQFGQHTNAHTSLDETVYKLFMPDNTEKSLRDAFTVLSDQANGLLLSQEEIDKERGVILEEARSGKSAGERIWKKQRHTVFGGTRLEVHDVIGDEDQIAKWNKPEFEDYYNTWYRPELMTLIFVGDMEPDAVVKIAREYFGDFRARAEARKPGKAELKPVEETRAFVLTDPEQVMGQVQVMAFTEGRPPMKTYEEYRDNELENIGPWIVNRRLQDMVSKGTAAFRGAQTGISGMLHEAIMPTAFAVGEPEDWNKMLDQAVAEISRAIDYGFTEKELDLARQEMISDAERAVERESTLNARALLGMLSGGVGSDEPILSAQQRLDLMKKIMAEATLEKVHKVFVDHFKRKNFTYVLVMPENKEGLTLPSSEDVLAAAAAAWSHKTEKHEDAKVAGSLLAELPRPGKIANKEVEEDLKITTVTFENGVVMHHRFMDYKKDDVLVSMLIPGGQIEETAENHGVGDVASLAFSQPATSRLDSTQIRDLMTGKKVNVRGGIGLDSLSLGISGSPADLETGFQLAHALLVDGVIEQSALDNWKKATLQQLERMEKEPQGQLFKAMDSTFYANDPRLIRLTKAQVEGQDVASAQKWLRKIASSGDMEVAVVGDIDLDRAAALVGQYLGSLPKRVSNNAAIDKLRTLKRGPGPFDKTVKFETITPQAFVLAGFEGCEDRDTMDRRQLVMASRVLSDRMIERIREKEQLVYSIQCMSRAAEAIKGLGLFVAVSTTDPEKVDKLTTTIIDMIEEFAKEGPTEQELANARKQMANMLETSMKEPSYWLSILQDMKYRGRTFEEIKQLPDIYMTFTGEQLKDAVAKYAKPDRAIRLAAMPLSKEPAKEKQEAAAAE